MIKFKNKYRTDSKRLQGFDYGSNGYYFVTICTQHKINYFGKIVAGAETEYIPSLQPTEMGNMAKECWQQIPDHFSFVQLHDFVVMPDHIHGILNFRKDDKRDWIPNSFVSPSQNLGSIVRCYKGAVKRYATQHGIEFQWQSGYHDIIVKDVKTLHNICTYIQNNPQKWFDKALNIQNTSYHPASYPSEHSNGKISSK